MIERDCGLPLSRMSKCASWICQAHLFPRDSHSCLAVGTVSAWVELKPLLTFNVRSLETMRSWITPYNKLWSGSSEQPSSATLMLPSLYQHPVIRSLDLISFPQDLLPTVPGASTCLSLSSTFCSWITYIHKACQACKIISGSGLKLFHQPAGQSAVRLTSSGKKI